MKKLLRLFCLCLCFCALFFSLHAQSSFADCSSARILCDKNPIILTGLLDAGNQFETFPNSCFPSGFTETNSSWLKWEIADAGLLEFTLLPLMESDDVDFALFRLSTLDDCAEWEHIRCTAAGPNLGQGYTGSLLCTGATGLNAKAKSLNQGAGCDKHADNFLKPVNVLTGEFYALFINNYRSTADVFLEWGGSCTFSPIPGKCQTLNTSPDNLADKNAGLSAAYLYPNPAKDRIKVAIESPIESACALQVIDSNGQVIQSINTTLKIGLNNVNLATDNLAQGVHFIKIKTKEESKILRFVKV